MDLQELQDRVAKDEEIVDIVIYQKDGTPYTAADGSTCTIGVVGEESAAYIRARDEVKFGSLKATDEELAASAKDPVSFLRKRRLHLASAAVKRWHGWELGGKLADLDQSNVLRVLGVEHILEQVESGISKRANFFGAASPS